MIHDHLYPGGGGQEGVPVGPGSRDSQTQGQPGTGGGGDTLVLCLGVIPKEGILGEC